MTDTISRAAVLDLLQELQDTYADCAQKAKDCDQQSLAVIYARAMDVAYHMVRALPPEPDEEVGRLREALEPFAKWAAWELDYNMPRAVAEDDSTPVAGGAEWNDERFPVVFVGDLKRARAALHTEEER